MLGSRTVGVVGGLLLVAATLACSSDSARMPGKRPAATRKAGKSPEPDTQPGDAQTAADASDVADTIPHSPEASTPDGDAQTPRDRDPKDAAAPPAADGATSLVDAGAKDAGGADCAHDPFELAFNTPDPTRDIFDPDEVYLVGSITRGCSGRLIAHWSQPNQPLAALGCSGPTSPAVLRSDGRAVFLDYDYNALRAFVCDGCTYLHTQDRYPSGTRDNDIVLPTPKCTFDIRLVDYRLSPDDKYIYRCQDVLRWYDEQGNTVLDGEGADSYGTAGHVLLANSVMSLSDGARVSISGLPAGTRLASRATEQGFQVALRTTDANDPVELWEITFAGAASRIGVYAAAPDGQVEASQLDPSGRLYQILLSGRTLFNRVVRRSIDGTAEVLYDEQTLPVVSVALPFGFLLSGPGPTANRHPKRVWGGEVDDAVCIEPSARWRYQDGPAAPSDPPVSAFSRSVSGPGVPCGSSRCTQGQICCETLSYPDYDKVSSSKCSANPNELPTMPNSCVFTDAMTACDEQSDCQGQPNASDNPPVCCFTTGFQRYGRECTTASACAAGAQSTYGGNNKMTGMLACQSDTDCALAGKDARCVFDPRVAGTSRANVGRCDKPLQAPDGTQVLSSSVLCGDTECSRVDNQMCCHTGTVAEPGVGTTSIERPTCTRSCQTSSGANRYSTHSYCDEARDCMNPLQATPGDPFECCMVKPPFGGPWHRECVPRSMCEISACRSDVDCARIHPSLHCRPERTWTGGGMARPEVRTCQVP